MRAKFFGIAFWVFWSALANLSAQNDPCFEANVTKGCAPLTVTVKDCSGADPSLIFYEFVPGSPTRSVTHTYTTPGTYTITQIVNSGGGAGKKLEKKDYITVVSPSPVEFELKPCVGGVYVFINDDKYDKYLVSGLGADFELSAGQSAVRNATGEVTVTVKGLFAGSSAPCGEKTKKVTVFDVLRVAEWKRITTINESTAILEYLLPSSVTYELETSFGTIFSPLTVLPDNSIRYTHSGNELADLPLNYRITTKDFCTGNSLVTNVINTTFLKAENAESAVILRWNTAVPNDFAGYRLYRDDKVIAEIKDISRTRFEDNEVVCNVRYCYRVEALFEAEAVQSVSNTVCINAVTTKKPNILSPFYVTIYNQLAKLQWRKPTEGRDVRIINFIRTRGGANRDTVYTIPVNDTTYLDLGSNPADSMNCYQISYTDDCGNVSDFTTEVCPVYLRMWRDEHYVNFDWSAYIPDRGQYFLEILNEKDETINFIQMGRYAATFRLNEFSEQTTRFRILFNSGKFISHSNVQELVLLPELEYPTAFTPNGDRLNDEFGAFKARFIRNYEINIFNQWGEVVFRSSDAGGRWDGTVNGKEAQSDTYTYSVTYEDLRGIALVKTGLVRLLR